jgi:hypothetical protein
MEQHFYNGAILMGFNYQNNHNEYLPGIIVDLYLMYKYCHDTLKIPKNQINIITDIKKREDPVAYAIIAGIVDSNIIDFIQEIKSYITQYDNLSFHQQIDNVLKLYNQTNSIDNFLFYYTGHGKDGYLKLPEKKTLSLITLRDLIFNNLSSHTYILWILDCCHTSNADLPFYFDYKYNYLTLVNNESIFKNKCLLITSCSDDNKTTATIKGSNFTRELVSLFKNSDIRTCKSLIKSLPKDSQIHTTFSNMYIIPSWIYGCDNLYVKLENTYLEISS